MQSIFEPQIMQVMKICVSKRCTHKFEEGICSNCEYYILQGQCPKVVKCHTCKDGSETYCTLNCKICDNCTKKNVTCFGGRLFKEYKESLRDPDKPNRKLLTDWDKKLLKEL